MAQDSFDDFVFQKYIVPKEVVPDKPKQIVPTKRLFVYGTLKFQNKHLLEGAKLVHREALMYPNYYLYFYKHLPLVVHYPHRGNGTQLVNGEVYEVTEEQYQRIYDFKFKKGIYEPREVSVAHGATALSFIYPKADPTSVPKEWVHMPEFNDYGRYLDKTFNDYLEGDYDE